MISLILLGLCLGAYSVPCHYCVDGEFLYGLNYTFAELGQPSCTLPTTVNCTSASCTRSQGQIAFDGGSIEFQQFKVCGPGCDSYLVSASNHSFSLL